MEDIIEAQEEAGIEPALTEEMKRGQRFKRCALCEQDLKGLWLECTCSCRTHVDCLAHHFLEVATSS